MVWDMRSIRFLDPREVILKRFAQALAEEKGMTRNSISMTELKELPETDYGT